MIARGAENAVNSLQAFWVANPRAQNLLEGGKVDVESALQTIVGLLQFGLIVPSLRAVAFRANI